MRENKRGADSCKASDFVDYDRIAVDRELAKNNGKQVNVLIDPIGGSLATGLSISAAFKNHGNVNVHFVGLNASAASDRDRTLSLKGFWLGEPSPSF